MRKAATPPPAKEVGGHAAGSLPQERMPVRVFASAEAAAKAAAAEIAGLIRERAAQGRPCVLGLATGSTPMGIYAELVRMHREEGLSFSGVTTFNLDEFWPMEPARLQSFRRFMEEHLFSHVDLDPRRTHVPDGLLDPAEVDAACGAYEAAIDAAGGIDLQVLGLGRTGHIGFNEPGSGRASHTRLIALDRATRLDAASDFFGLEHVPTRAITMGVGTILRARRVILLAFGESKAPIVRRMIEGPVQESVPATFLQEHPAAAVWLDPSAAADLTRQQCPWHAGAVAWEPQMVRKAVVWLSRTVGKPILKLTNEDYNEHGLQGLVAWAGRAYDINIDVFRRLQSTITGWPGGKPEQRRRAGDIVRPGDSVFPKRVLIFSPHPDDDVISMGGTLIRLVEQGHEVHVAYQTSGNIAVFDHDARRFLSFACDFDREINGSTGAVAARLVGALDAKSAGEIDPREIGLLKAMIRRGEAEAACRVCGLSSSERLHFLDMPFYRTGRVRKNDLGAEDVAIVHKLLETLQPHQIYAAGDLSDPHGTHRTCLEAVARAFGQSRNEGWAKSCTLWLYRGAWQEWDIERIDMAVPLSPDEVARKREAIFRHQSQKDRALFPGVDGREFWQRAQERNRATAEAYDALGLAEYEAIEAFVRWDGSPIR